MKQMENEIKRLEKQQRMINLVFGSLSMVLLIAVSVVCPLMMHLS